MSIARFERNKLLAQFTAYKIGGPADLFITVHSIDELVYAVSYARCNNIPYFILGSGANILFTDKGFRGLVIRNRANTITFLDNARIKAESGVMIEDLVKCCLDRGLSGFEHFAGIPGTVGGAMWQNLHFLSPDRQRMVFVEELVLSSFLYTEEGKFCNVDSKYFEFGYDKSILQERNDVVLEVTFQLAPKPSDEIKAVIDANISWRIAHQPQLTESPSCGSVFKRIQGIGAGRLIEQAGLKGMRIGGAEVSRKHSNFIINADNAKADDVIQLIQYIKEKIKHKFGYELETEIRIIGEL